MKLGAIVGLYIEGALILGASGGLIAAYYYNAESFQMQKDGTVIEKQEVDLAFNPGYPDETQSYTLNCQLLQGSKAKCTVYFDAFDEESSKEALEFKVSYGDYESEYATVGTYLESEPLTFEADLAAGDNNFLFTYKLSESGLESIATDSFSFESVLRVDKI